MATDEEEVSTESLAQRLERAKRELTERRNVEQSRKPGDYLSGSREIKSGRATADRAVQGSSTRARSAGRDGGDASWTSGSDEAALAVNRKGNSGYSPNGGRVQRNNSSGSQAGRQNAGQAALLGYKPKFEQLFRRILTYAGFDLKGDARALTEQEQANLMPHVVTFMRRVGMAMDWSITHTNKNHNESDIWMFEDSEAEVLATIYLKRARKIGWMAEVARQVQHLEDVGDAGEAAAILGKRIVATGLFYPANGGFTPWL